MESGKGAITLHLELEISLTDLLSIGIGILYTVYLKVPEQTDKPLDFGR